MSESEHAWPFYCEENVWHACGRPIREGVAAWVWIVSNRARCVAMWCQRAAPEGEPLLWDYHVALLEDRGEWTIRDVDCRAGPVLPAERWLDLSFGPLPAAAEIFAPRFRLVPADLYRRELQSDRSHMRHGDGWRARPPPWPPIGEGTNLMQFVDMEHAFHGRVLDLDELRDWLNSA